VALMDDSQEQAEAEGGLAGELPDEAIQREVTRRVAEARQAQGLTKSEFAARLGLSRQAYNGYEKGETVFSVAQLFRVGEILNRPVTYFLGLDSGLTPEEEQLLAIYRKGRGRGMGDAILRVSRALAGD
jgi:transcriptional regulator with XRE-family HTH domain